MSLWVIDKQEIATFVANMMGGYRVVGPVSKGNQFAFDAIEDPAELRLDYNTSILPPKKYLQPQEERLMTFNRAGKTTVETVIEAEPTVIMGVHTCDLHALRVLDAAFTQDYPDAHYLRRRRQTLLVGVECLEPCDEHSFCKSMGTLSVSNGYDLHLTDLGEAYAVDVGSEEGAALLEKYAAGLPGDGSRYAAAQQGVERQVAAFPLQARAGHWRAPGFDEPVIRQPCVERIGPEICLACGQCTLVCPTCYCFNVYDEVELNLQDGERCAAGIRANWTNSPP